MSTIEFTDEEQQQFDSWSKEDIYLAYVKQEKLHRAATREVVSLNRELSFKEYELKQKEEVLFLWLESDAKRYYSYGKLMGLIHTIPVDGVLIISALTRNVNDNFTFSMLKDIIGLIKTEKVCILTDVVSKQEQIASALSRYNMEFTHINGVLHSTN